MLIDPLPNPLNREVIRATETEKADYFSLRRRDPCGLLPWLGQDARTELIRTVTDILNLEE
jgi:hypothetical protein